MKVLPSSGTGVLNRGLTWTGDTLDTITDALDATRSETFGYSATRRLTSATGKYGAMGWSYDAVGNCASEVSGGTTKTFTTPAASNRLSTVTQGTMTLRSFGYDAAGAIATEAKAGVTWTSTYDAEGRVDQAQSGTKHLGQGSRPERLHRPRHTRHTSRGISLSGDRATPAIRRFLQQSPTDPVSWATSSPRSRVRRFQNTQNSSAQLTSPQPMASSPKNVAPA